MHARRPFASIALLSLYMITQWIASYRARGPGLVLYMLLLAILALMLWDLAQSLFSDREMSPSVGLLTLAMAAVSTLIYSRSMDGLLFLVGFLCSILLFFLFMKQDAHVVRQADSRSSFSPDQLPPLPKEESTVMRMAKEGMARSEKQASERKKQRVSRRQSRAGKKRKKEEFY